MSPYNYPFLGLITSVGSSLKAPKNKGEGDGGEIFSGHL